MKTGCLARGGEFLARAGVLLTLLLLLQVTQSSLLLQLLVET